VSGSESCSVRERYRSSIWSTSRSIISPPGSGNDFHAEPVLRARFGRILSREHRLKGGDRDLELVQRRLARGQLLKLQPRPHEPPHPAPAPVASRPLDHLVGEPGDEHDSEYSREDQPL